MYLLFLEPSRFFPHARVSRFLQPSLVSIFYTVIPNLWQSCHTSALLYISSLEFRYVSTVPLLGLFLHPFSLHAPGIATFIFSEVFSYKRFTFTKPIYHKKYKCESYFVALISALVEKRQVA